MGYQAAVAPLRRLPPSLHAFTYDVPAPLVARVEVGSIVEITFHASRYHGVVVRLEKSAAEQDKKIKDILDVTPLSVTKEQLAIAQFLSQFYVQSLGLIFNSFVASQSLRGGKTVLRAKSSVAARGKAARRAKQGYSFYTSPEALDQLLKEVLEVKTPGAQILIVTPDLILRERVLTLARRASGANRVLAVPRRSNSSDYRTAWVASQTTPIIVGSLAALLLPFQNLTHIIVVDAEHYLFQSAEQNPRYHLADILFPIAEQYGAAVLLTGVSPDVRLLWETQKRKLPVIMRGAPAGELTVVSLTPGSFSKKGLPSEVTAIIRENPTERILLLYNRTGDVKILQCRDCGAMPLCITCGKPYRYDSTTQKLFCTTDLTEQPMLPHCATCGGIRLDARGFGIERLSKELSKEFPERRILTITRGSSQGAALNENGVIVLATKAILYTPVRPFDVALWLKPEIDLGHASFHTAEQVRHSIKKLQGMSHSTFLVTATPEHPVFLTHNFIPQFFKEEITWRKKFSYPPFGRLYKGIIRAKTEQEATALMGTITASLNHKQLLGPYGRRGKNRYELVFGYKAMTDAEYRELDAVFRRAYNGFHLEINPYSLE